MNASRGRPTASSSSAALISILGCNGGRPGFSRAKAAPTARSTSAAKASRPAAGPSRRASRSQRVAQDRRARVAEPEHAMAEPHQPLAGGELPLGPGGDVAARRRLVEHVEGRPRRAAVQRPGKGAIGAERGRRQRGAARGDDPRGKGRGVEPVVDDRGRDRCRAPRPSPGRPARHAPCASRSSAVPRAGSGGERRRALAPAQQRGDRHRQGREDRRPARRRPARRRARAAPPRRAAARAARSSQSPSRAKARLARGAEPGADRLAVSPSPANPSHNSADRALIAEIGDQFGEGVAAHPQDAAARRRCGSAPSRRRSARRARYRLPGASAARRLCGGRALKAGHRRLASPAAMPGAPASPSRIA